MTAVIVIIGGLMMLISLGAVVAPTRVFQRARSLLANRSGWIAAIVLRLILGGLIIFAAPYAEYTLALQIFGALIVLAGLALIPMGHVRMKRMVDWWADRKPTWIRLSALFGLGLGAFLICAA